MGVAPQVDGDRSEVEKLTQQQRVISLENEVARQKIGLARMTGLPPNDEYDLTDDVPFVAAPDLSFDDALNVIKKVPKHRIAVVCPSRQIGKVFLSFSFISTFLVAN